MISFEKDLRSLILSTPVAALVSNRVVWMVRPQSSQIPSLVLTTVGEATPYVYGGVVNFYPTRVQFEIFSTTYDIATQIWRALEEGLSGFVGNLGDTKFHSILFLGKSDDTEENAVAAQQLVRFLIEASCNWSEI